MSAPAARQGDRIIGLCTTGHLVPSGSGTAPAPPQGFSAPLTQGLSATVLIGGVPAAVVGSRGTNTTPHAGLVDAKSTFGAQIGTITAGSTSVLFDGRAAAHAGSAATICYGAAQSIATTDPTVLIGG